jgi:hypothetical protein
MLPGGNWPSARCLRASATSIWSRKLATVAMNALGPVYAWLNMKLAAPHGH